jgi:hypothetical protein
LTDGGAGGQAVPTSADDVFFTAASGAVTVTVSGTRTCGSITFTGFTGTVAGVLSPIIDFHGNVTLQSGISVSAINFRKFGTSAATFLSNGNSINSLTVDNSTGSLSLSDAMVSVSSITITQGTFTTNNFNVTAASLSSSNSNVRTINLGSSTVTLSSSTPLSFFTNTNLTFNAGTSTLVFTSTTVTVVGGQPLLTGATFYNVQFTNTNANTTNIQGINTFNNLEVVAPVSAGVRQVTFDAPQTINGTLSTTGTAGNRRVWFRGLTYGLAQTLTINSAPSLTDADFRDIYVIGTAAPISGTRIGNLRGCRGITFSTPKTVYWNLAGGGNWSANAWAASSGGGVSTDNFPLAQDTAVIENTGLNTSATVTWDTAIIYGGTVNMSGRTNAMTFANANVLNIYGNWINGSGTAFSGSGILVFSGRNTQAITSAGKTFSNAITTDSYGGTVELIDALNIGTRAVTITNGTFDTKNYNVTAGELSSSNTNVRTIALGSSTVTLSASSSPVNFNDATNLTLNSGTSNIVCSGGADGTFLFRIGPTSLSFYSVSLTQTTGATFVIFGGTGTYTFNSLTVTAPASAGIRGISFEGNVVVTGTLTCAGATAVRRLFLRSSTLGTPRTLTVNSLSATDCDFRDITIAGTAAGSSPTRAGNCGGNTGITFPAPKTVYWSLAGSQNWSATAWATGSGGTPDINQFPLAQDTAVFDNAVAVTTASITASWNIGTLDMSGRTSAMTFNIVGASPSIHGNFLFGTGITCTGTVAIIFSGRDTQTITSNGVVSTFPITIDCFTGIVQLADALVIDSARTLTLTSGTFDAVTYNVTTGLVAVSGTAIKTLKMGSGTWTLSGTGSVWTLANVGTTFFKGTADIVLSDTSATARTFGGGNFSYNKLTIGGTTGISTLTINDTNQFTELASTKTVAHTIALGTTAQTFGAWTVTGTAGNVVTVTGTGTNHVIAGARVSGVDYLAMGTIGFAATSPGEFYAGANSTGSNATIIKTAAPAAVTRYWRGGTGTWDATTTTNWSASSGGAGGASVPTSADAVVFDNMSNATAYTVTCTATQLRCGSLTMAGPLVGNVTWAGTAPIAMHDNVTLAATGITRTYTGLIVLSGSATGRTLTTNGISFAQDMQLNGINSSWSLGSALTLNTSSNFSLINGTLNTANYNCSFARFFVSPAIGVSTLTLGSSTITENTLGFTINGANPNFILNAGTSTFNNVFTGGSAIQNQSPNILTFYNYNFTSADATSITITGPLIFNNLSFAGRTSAGITPISIGANQTINGTLTLSAGTNATMRTFLRSDTIGTTRTLTCAAFSGTDADFRDITIAGAAAPVSGTRLGDCKGNSGITFDAAKTVYWAIASSFQWGANSWSDTIGGSRSEIYFPLAQDTAVFPSTGLPSGSTATIGAAYNIGTIDMSDRTSNTMTLATGSTTPAIYGNWINGTGTTLTGTGRMTFAGRGSQTITSAGKTFIQPLTVNSLGGSVTLQDAMVIGSAAGSTSLELIAGIFDADLYNVTITTPSAAGGFNTNGVLPRTIAFGSGTWSIQGSGTQFQLGSITNLTVTGTGTISMTSASNKTFAGGGVSYSGITLNQGGAGALTITGNNTFANISNTYKATGATTIAMGTTTQTVGNFTASGEAGRVLTVQGTSASSPATLILTSGTVTTPDYLTVTGVRAYNLTDTWYAGANSTNNGSLGWIFAAGVVAAGYLGNFFAFF